MFLLKSINHCNPPAIKMKLPLLANAMGFAAYSTSAFTATRSIPQRAPPSTPPSTSPSTPPSSRTPTTNNNHKSRKFFTTLAYGEGMDQQTMMESDYLITVDKDDNPLIEESISKRKAHEFNPLQPRYVRPQSTNALQDVYTDWT